MDHKDVALQLTLKALETGYIPKKDWKICDGEDPMKAATEYTANQISDFYQTIYDRLGEL